MGSEFGGTWEDPWGGFSKFAVKRALQQDQIVHMEGKLQIYLLLQQGASYITTEPLTSV